MATLTPVATFWNWKPPKGTNWLPWMLVAVAVAAIVAGRFIK